MEKIIIAFQALETEWLVKQEVSQSSNVSK